MAILTVDYWRVTVNPATAGDLADYLGRILQWPEGDERRIFEYRDKRIALTNVKRTELRTGTGPRFRYRGEFTCVRHRAPGYRGDARGVLRAINFGVGEGLGDSTAFVYDPATQTLALERNRSGATSAAIVSFFENTFEELETLNLDMYFRPDAIGRYRNLKREVAIEVGIAGARGQTPQNLHGDTRDMIHLLQNLNGSRLDMRVSVSHDWREKSLDENRVRRVVRDLLSRSEGVVDVEKLKISGRTDTEESEQIDLLADRLFERVELTPDEGRGLSFAARVTALKNGLQKYRQVFRGANDQTGMGA